ncbi:MAG: AarF/ABC1/UbiB kinase family protein [Candidatus Hydrogenedentota bacterium]|nr:MAG: AarF/ABC1/UbiB kinase family protein [Candidatus Hydrogenedentota bacterium]
MQILRILFDLSIDLMIMKIAQPKGLARVGIGKRVFVGFLRIIFRRQKSALSYPAHFRRALERLGPTFVKLGQALSLRDDMLPTRFTRELQKLQAEVPAIPFSDVIAVIESQFGMPAQMVFKEIEKEPVAAASLAQTHLAKLRSGQRVIIKVQRPGIRQLMISDINIMRRVVAILQKFPFVQNYRPSEFVEEFADYTMRELDFTQEGKNADKFRENFKENRSVLFPRIYWDYTTPMVLTMEFIDGVSPTEHQKLKRLGIDAKKVAKIAAEAVLQMLFIDGFFHGDPHPNNIIIVGRSKVAWIDLGITGTFSDHVRKEMFLYYYYMVHGEYEQAVQYFMKLVTPGPKADPETFQKELAEEIKKWASSTSKEYSMGRLILETVNIGARNQLYFPRDLLLSSKAIMALEAVGRNLDPDLNMAEISKPYLEKIFLSEMSPLKWGKAIATTLPDYIDFLESLPQNLIKTLNMFASGKIRVELAENSQEEKVSPTARSYPYLSAASLLAATFFAISENTPGPVIDNIPFLAGMPYLAAGFFLLSGIFLFLANRSKS